MGFIKSASIASVLVGAATASPYYAPPSNETVKYTTEVVTHLTTFCPEATTLTYGEKTYTITEATTLTIEDCSCTITKPVATGTGYAPPPKPTHAKDCAEMCSDKYDDCRVAPNANMATCAAEYAACLNYNPWESGKFVKPTSCHAGGKPTAVYTTEVVTAVTTYCPEATTLTYGNKTIPVTAPGTVTVPNCHFTTTKPIVPTGYTPPQPSTPAENKGCAEKCSDAYNKCRTAPDANMSYCAATYSECLGYSPFNGEGSLVTPTACSVAPVATKPVATAPLPSKVSAVFSIRLLHRTNSIRQKSIMAAPKLTDPTLIKNACYVNGEWVAAKSGKHFAVENPSTLEKIGNCPEFDARDTEAAIAAADAAFKTYRKTPARQRARYLRRWYDLMMENSEDIARLITLENGKPLADGRTESNYAAAFFEWFSEEAPRIYGETIEATNPSCRLSTIKQPVGVCGLIAPWNFPAAMITRKAGPALAAGCTVVIKAPAEAPLTALALAELAHRAGIPAGVVNVITALDNTAEVGKVLTTHPKVKKVSFTGSTGVGRLLMNQSSSTIKKLSFELGGNAPFIVFEDADLVKAVKGVIACKFRNSGQTCVCANRILVHRSIYDKFIQMVLDVVKTFVVGDGFGEETTHGPLIHGRAVAKAAEHVEDALSKGAKLIHGGERLPHLGPNYFDLTMLTGMKPGMKICSEETFGPVAAFFAFDNEDEAIELANDSDVGLGGYFFSNNVNRCYRVAEALEVGMVGVNCGVLSDPAAPFGGIKQSGFGREGSKYGIDEFTITKMVMTNIDP